MLVSLIVCDALFITKNQRLRRRGQLSSLSIVHGAVWVHLARSFLHTIAHGSHYAPI